MTTNTAWANLPNAKHIDWVLDSVVYVPAKWHAAGEFDTHLSWSSAWKVARGVADDAGRSDVRLAAKKAIADRRQAVDESAYNALLAGEDALAALVAWDDACLMLDMPTDAVRLLAHSGHHPAVLMLPAVIVKNGEPS